jgi:hypothetical protein
MSTKQSNRIIGRVVVASRANAYGEYVVKAWDVGGDRYEQADYFTNDKADAVGTAKAMQECIRIAAVSAH